MWTLYQGKLQTDKFDESDPIKDEQNFLSLVDDMYGKLHDVQAGVGTFWKDKLGQLHIASQDTIITLTPNGAIIVSIPTA